MDIIRIILRIIGSGYLIWLLYKYGVRFFGKDARYRRKLRKLLRTAPRRTAELIDRLGQLPDESSRYRYLVENRSRELFVYGGYYWRVEQNNYWVELDRKAGFEVRNPITLVGMERVSEMKGQLSLPAEISLPGLTLGIMIVECGYKYDRDLLSHVKVEIEEYRDIRFENARVEKIDIPDSVTTLRGFNFPNVRSFRLPENFNTFSNSGGFDCQMLETVEFSSTPTWGCYVFLDFMSEKASLNKVILPSVECLYEFWNEMKDSARSECYGDYSDIDPLCDIFAKIENSTGQAVEIVFREQSEKFRDLVFPETYAEAERLSDFLECFPFLYGQMESVRMGCRMVWEDDASFIVWPGTDQEVSFSLERWRMDKEDDRTILLRLDSCVNLRRLWLPDTISGLPDYAFVELKELREIHLPESLESIGEYAFAGLSGLTHIELPASLRSIGEYAFAGLSGLTHIELPATLRSIGKGAFAGTVLTEVVIPEGCEVADGAFDPGVRKKQERFPQSPPDSEGSD